MKLRKVHPVTVYVHWEVNKELKMMNTDGRGREDTGQGGG